MASRWIPSLRTQMESMSMETTPLTECSVRARASTRSSTATPVLAMGDSSMLYPTTRVLDLGETMCCVSHHHEISRMRGRGGWSPSPTMSRHLQDVMPPMGWRTGPHSSVLEYGTRAGAHAYVRSTYHHGYVAHHYPKEYISRWIHGSMMWSTG